MSKRANKSLLGNISTEITESREVDTYATVRVTNIF